MKFLVSVVLAILFAAGIACADMPSFFMDFDDDGVSDETFVDSIAVGAFQPYNLYIGVDWADSAYSAMEYRVVFVGLAPPAVSAYAEPGDPAWALTIGSLTGGGWFQSGPCRGTGKSFVAKLSGVSAGNPGSPETFKFEFTTAPYEFPDLFNVYSCTPHPNNAYSINSAAINGSPPPVAAEPASWATVKGLFR
jgi:hypothetical protein